MPCWRSFSAASPGLGSAPRAVATKISAQGFDPAAAQRRDPVARFPLAQRIAAVNLRGQLPRPRWALAFGAEPQHQIGAVERFERALDPDRLNHIAPLHHAALRYRRTGTAPRHRPPGGSGRRGWCPVSVSRLPPLLATNTLKSVLFPAFGGPAITTRKPSRSVSARGRSSQRVSSRFQTAQLAREIGRQGRNVIFVRKVEHRLDRRRQPEHRLTPLLRLAARMPRPPSPWPIAAAIRFRR